MNDRKTKKANRSKSKAIVERKEDAGLTRIAKSIWVDKDEFEEAHKALDKAAKPFKKRADKKYRDKYPK